LIPKIIHQLWINPNREDFNDGSQLQGIPPEVEGQPSTSRTYIGCGPWKRSWQ
jgi:hypothetical protein